MNIETHSFTATSNVFSATLGDAQINWDGFWRLFEWLISPGQGHCLGASIRNRLIKHAFGRSLTNCCVRREFPISDQTGGGGIWANLAIGVPSFDKPQYLVLMDNTSFSGSAERQKVDSLKEYVALSYKRYPAARIQTIAVTNAPVRDRLVQAVYKLQDENATDYPRKPGWRLLHLQTLGAWVAEEVAIRPVDFRMSVILEEFADWCRSQRDGAAQFRVRPYLQ